jgi:hypothetical protein
MITGGFCNELVSKSIGVAVKGGVDRGDSDEWSRTALLGVQGRVL